MTRAERNEKLHQEAIARQLGRRIKICDEWLNDFTAFNKWAYENGYDENAPKLACTIDRINNDLGYSPENCRWVDIATQNRNKRQSGN